MIRSKSRQHLTHIGFVVCLGGAVTQGGVVPPGDASRATSGDPTVQFFTDYDLWLQAVSVQNVHTIDFQTLPDGSPTNLLASITPEFNYTAQGVTFSSPRPRLGFRGEFELEATSYPSFERNWIEAEFADPVYALGFLFIYGTLDVFGEDGTPLGTRRATVTELQFFGAIADVAIGSAKIDNGSYNIPIDDFRFVPVPEPMTATMLLLGAMAALGRRVTPRAIRTGKHQRREPCI
ncbi:MAG: hypothetical protein Q7R41_10395 [Phycisphaerales bacterium]|nr:hypothetical protein [Phycisphaerales bacterium]